MPSVEKQSNSSNTTAYKKQRDVEEQPEYTTPMQTTVDREEVPEDTPQPGCDKNSTPNATTDNSENNVVIQQFVNAISQPFQLFTDEQQTALEDDYASEKECQQAIYGKLDACSGHHQQLLDALQIGNVNETDGVFVNKLNHTFTNAGKYTLWKWLEHPLKTTEDIALRRKMRETLMSAPDTSRALRVSMSLMEEGWKSICWCWNDELSKTELIEGLLFTGMLAPLNEMSTVVNVYHFMRVCGTPLIHCLAPLIPVLLSYSMLRWMGAEMSLKDCWDMSTGIFKNALWFDNGNNSISQPPLFSSMMQGGGEQATGISKMINRIGAIVPKMMKCMKWVWWAVFLMNIVMMVHQCYRHYKLLAHVYRRTHQACMWVHQARQMSQTTTTTQSATQQCLDHLGNWVQSTSTEYSLLTSAFDFLNAYMLLRKPEVIKECKRLLRQVGVIDALQSVDTLLQRESFTVPEVVEHASTTSNNDSSVKKKRKKEDSNNIYRSEIEEDIETNGTVENENENENKQTASKQQPILELFDAYHPLLDKHQTKHSLSLDKHIVITGKNASGKSTVLKTMLLNVLLAQSWGAVCAKHMKWTPFLNIRGYLHTTDDCGKESLFQAQIRRIEEFIQEARTQTKQKKNPHAKKNSSYSLLVVDEILNSTNPIEAMLLSYQYARTIGSELSNCSRMVMTTHYPVLTTLADHHPEFANWAMQSEYQIGVNQKCKASSAILTVKKMTKVLGEREHACLEKAYKRMFKKLAKMRFKELDGIEDVVEIDTPVIDVNKGKVQETEKKKVLVKTKPQLDLTEEANMNEMCVE